MDRGFFTVVILLFALAMLSLTEKFKIAEKKLNEAIALELEFERLKRNELLIRASFIEAQDLNAWKRLIKVAYGAEVNENGIVCLYGERIKLCFYP